MFEIPEKVVVGGAEYEVVFCDRIRDSQGPVGRFDVMDGTIELVAADNEDFIRQTFLHEIVHALHYQMGYSGDQIFEDERYVDGLANALYALIKDNPGMFTSAAEAETKE